MYAPFTAPVSADRSTSRLRRLPAVLARVLDRWQLKPGEGLIARLRWLMFLLVFLDVGGGLVDLYRQPASVRLKLAGLIGLVLLTLRRRARYLDPDHRSIWDWIEAPALFTLIIALGAPTRATGFFFSGLSFFALSMPAPRLAVYVASYMAALAGATLVLHAEGTIPYPLHEPPVIDQLRAAPLISFILYLLATSIGRLERSERRFRALVHGGSDMILVIDADQRLEYVSPSVMRLLGYPTEDHPCVHLSALLHESDLSQLQTLLERASAGDPLPTRQEWRLRRHDGDYAVIEMLATNLLSDPDVRGMVLNGRDITDRKSLEHMLSHQAYHDALTGLANRTLFTQRLRALLATSPAEESVAVILIDLDNFKTVNDGLGHLAGDALLIAVSQRLVQNLRSSDMAARLGGDEFVVLLTHEHDPQHAVGVASRLAHSLLTPFHLDDREIFTSASIGIALNRAMDSAEAMLRDADAAMYRAKSGGKGRLELFTPAMHTAALKRLELEAALRRAVDRQEFILYYQPILRLEDAALVGFEALIRWLHPERGLVPPIEFIPLAEETRLIVPMGMWAMREAVRQLKQWQADHPAEPPLSVTVNLSAEQLREPELAAQVAALLNETGIPRSSLVLELTESMVMQDVEASLAQLRALKHLGVRLALDDFGTGYSSLSYLRRLPVDLVKIDRSFVSGIGSEHRLADAAVARAIITLSQALQLQVIAEGIERVEQRDALRMLGCRLGQGYFFSRPVPVPEAERLVRVRG